MDLPQQFPYGPRLKALLGFYAIGFLLCAIPLYSDRHTLWLLSIGGLLFLFLALAGTFRRFALRPCLEFSEDKFVIRRSRIPTEVPYASIRSLHEARYGRMKVLKLQTQVRAIEINSTLLKDNSSFETIRDFLKTRIAPDSTPKPKAPGIYLCKCSYEGNGEIYDSNGELLWLFKTLHFKKPHYPYGLFRMPDFIVCDRNEKEIFRIQPERRWMLLARFVMTTNGSPICATRLRSIFRNKYTLDFANGERWLWHMPLFTLNFSGISEKGDRIRAHAKSHRAWTIFIPPQDDRPELIAAIAFLHRERLRFN